MASETITNMSHAFTTLIESVGERPEREGLQRTPMRAAKALCFFTKGYEDNLSSKLLDNIMGGEQCQKSGFCSTSSKKKKKAETRLSFTTEIEE